MVLSSTGQVRAALRLIEQAIARDPRYGPALAWAAHCCYRLVMDGRSDDPVADRLKGTDFARRALEVAADDPRILANTAHALAYFGEDIGAMMALVDRALALNPSYARGWLISSGLRSWAGQADTAIEHAEASLRLSPRARIGASMLSRRIQAMRTRIGSSPPATRIWAGLTTPETSSRGCALLPRL
jgi:tetratricopeptide (TPR) repeat protein